MMLKVKNNKASFLSLAMQDDVAFFLSRRGAIGCFVCAVILFLSSCALFTHTDPADLPKSSKTFWKGSKEGQLDSFSALKTYAVPPADNTLLPAPVRTLTPEVRREMDILLAGRQHTLRSAFESGNKIIKPLSKIFEDEGVPPELLYVAMIESGFNGTIRSPMGAVGLWQFMKSTAQLYGLKVNFFMDERKDMVLSSIAAARHLKDLYREYKDWNLVLAAYNAGPGTVNRAIRLERDRNFWNLARKNQFRMETVKFVAKFSAIIAIMDNPEAHGIQIEPMS